MTARLGRRRRNYPRLREAVVPVAGVGRDPLWVRAAGCDCSPERRFAGESGGAARVRLGEEVPVGVIGVGQALELIPGGSLWVMEASQLSA